MKVTEMFKRLGIDAVRAEAEANEILEDLRSKGIGDPEALVIVLSVAASVEGGIRDNPHGAAVADAIREFCEEARKHVVGA